MKPTCVIATDNHQTLLRSLKRLLEPEYEVIAMTDNMVSMVEAISNLEPDFVILDIPMEASHQPNTVHRIASRFPKLRIIVLGDGPDQSTIDDILTAGAVGYLPRLDATRKLRVAVERVLQGQSYVSTEVETQGEQTNGAH